MRVAFAQLLEHRLVERQIYGSAYQKTYKNVYDGGRLRKRRVYRDPTAEEVERAIADPDTVVELAERRRA